MTSFAIHDEKYALLIVNTFNLPNAVNDSLVQVVTLLNWGWSLENIYILTDNDKDPRIVFLSQLIHRNSRLTVKSNQGSNFVTRYNNILQTIAVRAKGKTSLFISISGHGGQVRDLDGDEADGMDECIYPGGFTVIDDHLYAGLLNLGSNFDVLACADTCHSGTIFDLDSKNETPLKANVLSLSACSDNEYDWETGCNLDNVRNFLSHQPQTHMSTNDVEKYKSYLPTFFTTGSLTSSIVKHAFDGLTEESLNKIKNKTLSLGQHLTVSSTLTSRGKTETPVKRTNSEPVSTITFWTFIWIFVILVIVIIIIAAILYYLQTPIIMTEPEKAIYSV